jgi:hypothetical protein
MSKGLEDDLPRGRVPEILLANKNKAQLEYREKHGVDGGRCNGNTG